MCTDFCDYICQRCRYVKGSSEIGNWIAYVRNLTIKIGEIIIIVVVIVLLFFGVVDVIIIMTSWNTITVSTNSVLLGK